MPACSSTTGLWAARAASGEKVPSLLAITTVIGLYLGILIGNSVLTEIVFSRPGLGKLILTALSQRDYTLLQGMIVVYTLMVVVVNLLTDLTYGFLDPRVQYK